MIEIKNKRMLLFPEDRIIGVQGDINTAERKFVLDRVQDGYDLSDFVAWLKLEPSSGEGAYSQLVKKEIVGERIVLTWLLSGANLKHEGELSVQVVLASPDYFNEDDLKNIPDDCLIVPSIVSGVSAPVWQSHKETFVIDGSIDDAKAYEEITKNVLVSALANVAQNVEKTQELYEECNSISNAVSMMYGSVCENMEYAETLRSSTEAAALSAQDSKEIIENLNEAIKETAAKAEQSTEKAAEHERISNNNAEISTEAVNDCITLSNQCYEAYEMVKTEIQEQRNAEDYKLIFSKTLTEQDTGCVAFEIDKDINGAPLNLREFCFFVYVPAMPNAQNSYLRLEVRCGNNSTFSRISQFVGMARNSDSYLRIEANNKGRWTTKYSRASAWFQNAESVSVGGTISTNSRTSDGKKAKAVRIVQTSDVNADFPVGTSVELWGINCPVIEEGANE